MFLTYFSNSRQCVSSLDSCLQPLPFFAFFAVKISPSPIRVPSCNSCLSLYLCSGGPSTRWLGVVAVGRVTPGALSLFVRGDGHVGEQRGVEDGVVVRGDSQSK